MFLTRRSNYRFSFNILNAIRDLKTALRAPVKHFKSLSEATGKNHSIQTNTTVEGFDQLAREWQSYVGNNPFDLQTYNYLQNAQLSNFGTVDNPLVIFTADAPFRYVGCSGPQNQDDYESHQLLWMMIREGPLQRCGVCGQVFKLVRLRDEFSAEMDYYIPNFNKMYLEDLGEHDVTNNLSVLKSNTHFEPSLFEQPRDSTFSFINPDDHDRILTDPAYRMQKLAESDMKARIYEQALADYENEVWETNPYRHPISKLTYENLIEAEAVIKKHDRLFRKVAKFESRKFTDFENHQRREKRMQERASKRWDNSYTIFSGELTEQEQRYRDYFETDLENYKQDQRMEEFLDKQELLSSNRYNLNKYDFQEGYTMAPEDDQTSYLQKKIFKFKYRKALDSAADYERRNKRMVEGQRRRFQEANAYEVIDKYISNPKQNERDYLNLVGNQSIAQYNQYFQSEQNQFDNTLFESNKEQMVNAFENWQLPKQDKSSFKTLPLPEWKTELGIWSNSITLLQEISRVDQKVEQIERHPKRDLVENKQK